MRRRQINFSENSRSQRKRCQRRIPATPQQDARVQLECPTFRSMNPVFLYFPFYFLCHEVLGKNFRTQPSRNRRAPRVPWAHLRGKRLLSSGIHFDRTGGLAKSQVAQSGDTVLAPNWTAVGRVKRRKPLRVLYLASGSCCPDFECGSFPFSRFWFVRSSRRAFSKSAETAASLRVILFRS